MLINPTVLLESLTAVKGLDEFQVALTRQDASDAFSMDEMIVRVASARSDRDGSFEVTDAAQTAARIRPKINFVEASDIYDPAKESKAVRLVDKR